MHDVARHYSFQLHSALTLGKILIKAIALKPNCFKTKFLKGNCFERDGLQAVRKCLTIIAALAAEALQFITSSNRRGSARLQPGE
jgi:hypothetical protein